MIRCALLSVVVCLATGLAAPVPAEAQAWPTKTVTVVVPFGPGNALETIGRPVLEQLSLRLGQPFIVENRAGAGGSTGTAYVARAPADGYTILFHSSTLSITTRFTQTAPMTRWPTSFRWSRSACNPLSSLRPRARASTPQRS